MCCYECRSTYAPSTPSPQIVPAAVTPTVSPPEKKDRKAQQTIWDLVETCETADADNAATIRSHLGQSVGKVRANELLSDAYATSSRDNCGKKQRIFTIDGEAIRVKRA